MASDVPVLLFLNLAFSMGFLINFKPLLTFFLHNCNISPIYLMSIHTFFLLLMTMNFFLAILILILHFSIPNSACTKQLTTAARVLTFATLLFMAVLVTTLMLIADVVPDAIKTTFAAAATMIAYISYVRSSFNLFTHLTTGFVPVCFVLCVSMATLYLTEQSPSLAYHRGHTNSLSNILIHLVLFGNFILAIVLLFLRAALDMQPRLITAVLVERIAKAAVATSIIIILIGVYMTVAVQVGIESISV